MYEALTTQVHANVGHLPLNIEEQQISRPQITSTDSIYRRPKLSCGAWDCYARLRVGILHQATAVEAVWSATTVAIGNANLVKRYSRRTLTDGEALCGLSNSCIGAAAS